MRRLGNAGWWGAGAAVAVAVCAGCGGPAPAPAPPTGTSVPSPPAPSAAPFSAAPGSAAPGSVSPRSTAGPVPSNPPVPAGSPGQPRGQAAGAVDSQSPDGVASAFAAATFTYDTSTSERGWSPCRLLHDRHRPNRSHLTPCRGDLVAGVGCRCALLSRGRTDRSCMVMLGSGTATPGPRWVQYWRRPISRREPAVRKNCRMPY